MKKLFLTALLLSLASCGGGGMFTNQDEISPLPDDNSTAKECTVENKCSVTITKNAFLLGSDFPADIVIPDIDNMRGTAFIVTSSSPSGVIPVDLDSNPLSISKKFAPFVAPDGTGFPSSLFIASQNRAFLLTSSHVIDFNPENGEVNTSLALSRKIELPANHRTRSDASIVTDITPDYPSSVVASGGKLFVTTSNYVNPVAPAVANPGTVLVFEISAAAPYLKFSTAIATTGFVPTGITKISEDKIAITNSGVSDLVDAHAEPKTESSIDILDVKTLKITKNISLGKAGLSFQEMAVTHDGKRAFIGSTSYGELYELDLENGVALQTHDNPIVISGSSVGSDYLTAQVISHDDKYVFVASFENSAIYPVDISGDSPLALPAHFSTEPFVIGFPAGVTSQNPTGENTGAGPLAVRHGIPGTDFTSPDIFATTGYPGTIVAINTHRSGAEKDETELTPQENESSDEDDNDNSGENNDDEDNDSADNNEEGAGVFAPLNLPMLNQTLESYTLSEVFAKKIGPKIGRTNPIDVEEPEETLAPCTDFAKAIISVKISKGGGMNFSKLPDVVLGEPEAPINAAGMAGAQQSVSGVLSLGNGGEIVLDTGDCEIVDGDGNDFTVFENAFFIQAGGVTIDKMLDYAVNEPEKLSVFSEPAEVSVSSDGTNFVKFPCDFDAAASGNFADKKESGCAGVSPVIGGGDPFVAGYENGGAGGDSFDLADIGVEKARFVKIKAAGSFVQPDDPQNPGSGNAAFDLDALAVTNGEKK